MSRDGYTAVVGVNRVALLPTPTSTSVEKPCADRTTDSGPSITARLRGVDGRAYDRGYFGRLADLTAAIEQYPCALVSLGELKDILGWSGQEIAAKLRWLKNEGLVQTNGERWWLCRAAAGSIPAPGDDA